MKPLNALVFGSVTIDIITSVASQAIERVTMQNATTSFLMLEQGRKIEADKISTFIGGGAANVSVSMARQGVSARIFSLTGNDLNAKKIKERLLEENVNTNTLTSINGYDTGIGVLISAHDHNAAIFTHRGANTRLNEKILANAPFNGSDVVYIAPLSDDSADCFPSIVSKARSAGSFIATNPGIRQLSSRPEDFMRVINDVNLLTLNKVELLALFPYLAGKITKHTPHIASSDDTPLPSLLKTGLKVGALSASLVDTIKAILHAGVTYVAVTDGADGAYLMNNEAIYHVPPNKVNLKGTAGAGDAFASTLAAQLAAGMPPEKALTRANTNAASVVTEIDTMTGLMHRKDIEDVDICQDIQIWPVK